MSLHSLFFPNCNQHEIDRLRTELVTVRNELRAVKAELKSEVSWNRKLSDRMVNFGLTKAGQFGVEVRQEPAAPAVPEIQPPATPDADQTREEQIDARVIELEAIYAQRGRNVPRPEIRKMVEANFVYLMDDDRVEL